MNPILPHSNFKHTVKVKNVLFSCRAEKDLQEKGAVRLNASHSNFYIV